MPVLKTGLVLCLILLPTCATKFKTKISEAQEQKHLEQSIQNVPDLVNIKKTSKPLEINTGKTVSLDAWATLLNEAAMDCDC